MTASRQPASTGSRQALTAWAARMTAIGRRSAHASPVPISTTAPHTSRNFHARVSAGQPSVSATAYAAASGAVMALVSPAANNPIAKSSRACRPASGSSWAAMSAALSSGTPCRKNVAAAVARMASVNRPPRPTDTHESARAVRNARPAGVASRHLVCAALACRNRL